MVRITGSLGVQLFGARVMSEWRPVKGGSPLSGLALIDTGADSSLINTDARAVSEWTPEEERDTVTGVVGAKNDCPLYAVNLVLKGAGGAIWTSPQLNLPGLPLGPSFGAHAIIGWDILQYADFNIDKRRARFTIEVY